MAIRSNALTNLELFEELNDQVSEKISGGATLGIDLQAINQNISQLIDLNLSSNLAKKLEELGIDADNQTILQVACVNGNCKVNTDNQSFEFQLDNDK